MKKGVLLFFFVLLFSGLTAQAQGPKVVHPVKWKSKIEKKSADQYLLTMDAVIEDGWHVYSQFTDENGSLPMIVEFINKKGNFEAIGKTSETKPEQKYSDIFGVTESFWHHKFQLKQLVKVTNPGLDLVQVKIDYQVCQESCIQEISNFEFNVKTLTSKEVVKFSSVTTSAAAVLDETAVSVSDTAKTDAVDKVQAGGNTDTAVNNTEAPKENKEEPKDPWTIFLGTLLAGILVTFTPCVFPMIPMTVSFFLKQNSSKSKGRFNAVFYGICIVAIYILLSVPFHIFEGISENVFADISTNVYLNLFFFAIFVTFAISFFGAFEITMPNSLASKADNASNSGGLIGVFFMALTLIIVSFSCTGPALGLVFGTVLSSEGGAILLTVGLTGFGLGLAMPFMVFALFPNLMGNLPKSGGWLNTVKVVFGFIELALAFKFLSNADLVEQWHILEREVFIAIWIGIFLTLTFYLFGKFSTPHDSPVPFISVGRMLLGVLSLCFTIYLIPGLWGAPLKVISGFPPPLNYSESPFGFGGSGGTGAADGKVELPANAEYIVHGIVAFHDYDKGLAYAKSVNKPILIDFTGHACVNCRKMEEYVWSDPAVLSILKNDVVLISLYCDSRKKLPENEVFTSKSGREITTVGEKWSDFEVERYASNARPYYVLVNPADEAKLNEPVAYTPDVEEYKTWLTSGIANFKK
ncbi:protein-disulfide reductase DsbD family protein [Flavobacterium suzhouense]|uniref:Thioredoxin family protein n=1 Tax=Flavobacterium suzhouense TaxID=1529638 RepID=A0ABW5NVA5_9FLAO